MKNVTLYTLKEVIEKVKDLGKNDFRKPLIYIDMEIDKEISVLEALRKPSEEYEKFSAERVELLSKHAEIGDDGKFALYSLEGGKGERVHKTGQAAYFNIIKDKGGFEKATKEMELKYEEVLKKEKLKEDDFQNTLQEDSEIEFTPIPFDVVPEMPYDYMKLFLGTGVIEH